ncbi:anaphase-promoting complex subunit Hcn1, partial [Kappamyces sp. JEL0680]
MAQTDAYILNFFNAGSIMFSSGWAVAAPTETIDRIPKIINMVISAFLFALFTANITTYMIRLDSSGRQFNEKLEEITQYVTFRGLGKELHDRIIYFYRFKYNQRKYFDEEKILSELNHPLRVVGVWPVSS